jgi:hypothetical protein
MDEPAAAHDNGGGAEETAEQAEETIGTIGFHLVQLVELLGLFVGEWDGAMAVASWIVRLSGGRAGENFNEAGKLPFGLLRVGRPTSTFRCTPHPSSQNTGQILVCKKNHWKNRCPVLFKPRQKNCWKPLPKLDNTEKPTAQSRK